MLMRECEVAIVGGGPAGMVAACLLARGGASVLVLEQNADFSREFRGEILQPRFQQAMRDCGLYEHLQGCPHEEIDGTHIYFQGLRVGGVDASWLDRKNPAIWWMTQPNLLSGLHAYARQFTGYEIWFDSKVTTLSSDRTLTVRRNGEACTVRAKVIIGADGRFSTISRLGGFVKSYDHHDLDVIWFLLERPKTYHHYFSFFLGWREPFLILPKHPHHLQCGMVFRPGAFQKIRDQGIDAFRQKIRAAHPIFREFADQLTDFKAFHPLKGNRALIEKWVKDGVVLIGDAAHTCSPAGGIGVSIAIETAIVAASVILSGIKSGDLSDNYLAHIQALRWRQVKEAHLIQGQGRLFLNPVFRPLRLLIPLIVPLLSASKILPLVARRLLTQRSPFHL